MMMKNLLITVVCIILLFMFLLYRCSSPQTTQMTPVPNSTLNSITNGIEAKGIVEAYRDSVSVGIPVSGIVKKAYVQNGSRVRKGDPLFELDNRDLIAQLYVQEANVAVREANLKNLQDQTSHLKSSDIRAVTNDIIKSKQDELSVAEAELKLAHSQVTQTKLLLERLLITSPQDGVVINDNVRVGEFLQKDATIPFMTVGDIDQLQVRVYVDEQYIPLLQNNPPAVAYIKGDRSNKIPLRFLRIEPNVVTKKIDNEERRVLQVIYTMPSSSSKGIYVGQSLDVFIEANP